MSYVYFARHNWSSEDYSPIIEKLFSERSVGVHFKDIPSGRNPLDPLSYTEASTDNEKVKNYGQREIRYLNKLNTREKEKIVISVYRNKQEGFMGNVASDSLTVDTSNQKQIKLVRLDNVVKFTVADFPLPFLVPPPFSTLVKWERGGNACKAMYSHLRNNTPIELSLDLLTPRATELMCDEYLRRTDGMKYTIFPSGGTLRGIDIMGVSKNERLILAQVKNKNITSYDLRVFRDFCSQFPNPHSVYFCLSSSLDKISPEPFQGIEVQSLKAVFDYFHSSDKDFLSRITFGFGYVPS